MIKRISNQLGIKEVEEWLRIKKGKFIGVDTETTGLNPHSSNVLLLQLGDGHIQYVIDIARVNSSGRTSVITSILESINRYDIKCIMHNAKFDYKMLKYHFGVELNNMLDTMIGAKLLTLGFSFNIPVSLSHTLEKFLGIKMDKSVRDTFHEMVYGDTITDEQVEYSGLDVKYLIKLKDAIIKKLNKYKLLDVAILEWNTVKVTGDMELNGVLVDTALWRKLEYVAQKEADELKNKLDNLFDPYLDTVDLFGKVKINYNSTQQMKKYLSKALGYELKSTAEKILKTIDSPIVKTLLQYRKKLKLVTTYGSKFLKENLCTDGKIRSTFIQLGPDTGRYASKDPNLQNIPSKQEYRRPFIAPRGYKFISADFSGQELRLLAHLSQEPEMIKALKENKDLHTYSASLIYKIPYESFFKKDNSENILKDSNGELVYADGMKKLRNNTKKISFGLLYGLGPGGLAADLGISIEEARELIRIYFNTFKGVKKLMDKLKSDLHKNHYANSPLDGRKSFYFDIDWNHRGKVARAERQAQNFPFQGTGASTTKLALTYIDEEIKKEQIDAQILFAVHDEINLICKESQANKCAKLVQDQMVRAFNKYAPTVPMEVVANIGDWWIH